MNTLYKYGTIAGVTLALIIAAFFYGKHVESTADALAQAQAVAKAQKKADDLSRDNTALTARVSKAEAAASTARHAAANQPPQTRYIYVHIKPTPSSPTPAPVAVTGPVFVTAGAVGLYNDSLGLPGLYGSGEPFDPSSALPSTVTVSQYQLTTIGNNSACYVNTTRLTALQTKVQDWIKAGVIQAVP